MDDTTFRILDALSRNLGRPTSIRQLTREIKDLHGTAYYANIYRAIQGLAGDGLLRLTPAGRSSLVSLDFRSYLTPDVLTEVEFVRKRRFLGERKEWQMLLADLEERLRSLPGTGPACLLDPGRNAKLNRAELLILLEPPGRGSGVSPGTVHAALADLGKRRGVRLDALVLGEDRLIERLRSSERNPVQEMLANEIAFHAPEDLWAAIRDAVVHGLALRFLRPATNPAKIPERDLVTNLARFGYREMGTRAESGEELCLEFVLTALLMQGDARRIGAIPALLAKNPVDYPLLVFLARRHSVDGALLGLLRALDEVRPDRTVQDAVESLERMGVKGARTRQASIGERRGLYDALG